MAEGAGFEPAIRFPVYTLSRRAPSTTRPPLRTGTSGAASTCDRHRRRPASRAATYRGCAASAISIRGRVEALAKPPVRRPALAPGNAAGLHRRGSRARAFMIRFILRSAGFILLAVAFSGLVVDGTRSIAAHRTPAVLLRRDRVLAGPGADRGPPAGRGAVARSGAKADARAVWRYRAGSSPGCSARCCSRPAGLGHRRSDAPVAERTS